MERSYILVTNGSCRGFRCWRSFKNKKKGKNGLDKEKNLPGMVVVGFSVIGARGTRY